MKTSTYVLGVLVLVIIITAYDMIFSTSELHEGREVESRDCYVTSGIVLTCTTTYKKQE